MATRRESVILDLEDRVSPGLLKVAASAEVADEALQHLDGAQLRASGSSRTLESDTGRLVRGLDRVEPSARRAASGIGRMDDDVSRASTASATRSAPCRRWRSPGRRRSSRSASRPPASVRRSRRRSPSWVAG
jgi:hypothetical protein